MLKGKRSLILASENLCLFFQVARSNNAFYSNTLSTDKYQTGIKKSRLSSVSGGYLNIFMSKNDVKMVIIELNMAVSRKTIIDGMGRLNEY